MLPEMISPKVAPDIPPQVLACGKLGFVRLTETGFDAFSTSLRKRLARIDLAEPQCALALSGDSTLVVGKHEVVRYYRGQKQAPRFARIPLLGPLQAWADPQDIDSFWVRYLRDPDLHYYTLVDADRSVTFGQVRNLPDFDRRHFTLLADGSPFYTTERGLLQLEGNATRESPPPALLGALNGVWPAARLDRYWVSSDAGELKLFEQSRGEPLRRSHRVDGVPYAVDVDGERLAIVSVSQTGSQVDWHLSVIRGDETVARLELPMTLPLSSDVTAQQTDTPSSALDDHDNRDVCLLQGRPWVLAGGKRLLQLFDYEKQELLQTWDD